MGQPVQSLGGPLWEHSGVVCTGEVNKVYVKLTFAGAALADPSRLFQRRFNGGTRRAIDIRVGQAVDPAAFALGREAVALNVARLSPKRK